MRTLKLVPALLLLPALLVACAGPAPTGTPPAPTPAPTLVPTPALVEVTVYFADSARFSAGTLPFEGEVTRLVPAGADLPEAVLEEYFRGPTAEEQARDLIPLTNGFTGFRLELRDGIAHVYLTGPCQSTGGVYTIAQPLMKNLLQFEEIRYVKIYDADGVTTEPEGESNSIPFCLEP